MRRPERRLIFGAPVVDEADIAAVTECLRSGWIGLGERVTRFEHEFADYKTARYAAAVSSGTAALHVTLVAMGIGAGDEVIAPTMTFCSTVHSILHAGATPVLVDCQPETFNIDPDAIEARITPRTKAILVVHMCGRCCDMDPIMAIARKHGLRVIEDCAHAIEASYHGTPAGLIGDAGCFSFYATKNMTTVDGGMVITRDAQLHDKIKLLSLHGMTSDAWTRAVRGGAGYDVTDLGFKYNMTDVEAALGLSQLRRIEERWIQRERLWNRYNELLADLDLVLPAEPEPETRHAYHLYTPLLRRDVLAATRDQIIAALRAENIGVGMHYEPVHSHTYYRTRFRFEDRDFPNATRVGEQTISLPLTAGMTEDDVADVCGALRRIVHYYAAKTARVAVGATPTVTKSEVSVPQPKRLQGRWPLGRDV